MPLLVSIAGLHRGSVHLSGELSPEDVALETLDPCVTARSPVRYEVRAELMGHEVFVEGWLETTVECECVRCLAKFDHRLRIEPWNCLLPLEGEEAAPVVDESVDLTPQIREDSLLALPQHPLCRTECPGLLSRMPLDSGHPDGSSDEARRGSSAWSVLDKLKLD